MCVQLGRGKLFQVTTSNMENLCNVTLFTVRALRTEKTRTEKNEIKGKEY